MCWLCWLCRGDLFPRNLVGEKRSSVLVQMARALQSTDNQPDRLPFSELGPEVCRRAQRSCSPLQGGFGQGGLGPKMPKALRFVYKRFAFQVFAKSSPGAQAESFRRCLAGAGPRSCSLACVIASLEPSGRLLVPVVHSASLQALTLHDEWGWLRHLNSDVVRLPSEVCHT